MARSAHIKSTTQTIKKMQKPYLERMTKMPNKENSTQNLRTFSNNSKQMKSKNLQIPMVKSKTKKMSKMMKAMQIKMTKQKAKILTKTSKMITKRDLNSIDMRIKESTTTKSTRQWMWKLADKLNAQWNRKPNRVKKCDNLLLLCQMLNTQTIACQLRGSAN